jgi:hypothetical protein
MMGVKIMEPLFENKYTAINIIIALLLLAICLYRYKHTVKFHYTKDLELNQGKETEWLIRVTAREIELQNISIGRLNIYELSQFIKVIETKKLYILLMKSRLAITLRKDSFTVGTLDEFKNYIKKLRIICYLNKRKKHGEIIR